MNLSPTAPLIAETGPVPVSCDLSLLPTLCWGAIIAGTISAVGIHFLLSALGVGAGLATFTPMNDVDPITNFSIGAAVVWSGCALVALCFGGLIAGRFSHSLQSGFVHGVLVWSLTLIITVLLLSMGTGMILGGALRVLGEGLGIGGKAVAAVGGNLAEAGIKRSVMQLESFIEEGVHSGPTNAIPSNAIRARREIGFAVASFFAPGNDLASPGNRMEVVKSLVSYAGLSEPAAIKTVEDWTDSYQRLKAELEKAKIEMEQKARQAADKAASNLSCAAIWSFFALLSGLLVTALSASWGARRALSCVGPKPVSTN